MARALSFVIEGAVATLVRVSETLDGTLSFAFTVLGPVTVSEIRAVFFDLNRELADDGFTICGDAGMMEGACVEKGVDTQGREVRIDRAVVNELGDFDVRIAFDPLERAGGDPRVTDFTLAHGTMPLTLDMIGLADFGLRHAPVGESSARAHEPDMVDGRARHLAGRDALEVIEIRAASVSTLADGTDGGVLAVIGVGGTSDAIASFGGGFEPDPTVTWRGSGGPCSGGPMGDCPAGDRTSASGAARDRRARGAV